MDSGCGFSHLDHVLPPNLHSQSASHSFIVFTIMIFGILEAGVVLFLFFLWEMTLLFSKVGLL